MPPISIMLKPASSLCNLRCGYCFYHSLAESREAASHGIMSAELYRGIIRKAFDFTAGKTVMLSFQGGEPLLAGKAFFRNVIKITKEENQRGAPVRFAIQTNGTLIDDEWCGIFKKGSFLVGLSLDGDRTANALRVDADGNQTFDKVIAAAELLKKHGVDFNILTVLTKQVAGRIECIYDFFKRQNFKNTQFIPCLKPLDDSNTNNTKIGGNNADNMHSNRTETEDDCYLSGSDYQDFLFKCFAHYIGDVKSGRFTSIRNFDNLVMLAHNKKAEQCGMNGHCCHQFVIEADGETYPCDFYCTDKYSLGNITETDFGQLSAHPVAIGFIKESLSTGEKCKSCAVYALCRGGCKRERIDVEKCEALKIFLPYAIPFLKNIT